jgi:hypothetical protein
MSSSGEVRWATDAPSAREAVSRDTLEIEGVDKAVPAPNTGATMVPFLQLFRFYSTQAGSDNFWTAVHLLGPCWLEHAAALPRGSVALLHGCVPANRPPRLRLREDLLSALAELLILKATFLLGALADNDTSTKRVAPPSDRRSARPLILPHRDATVPSSVPVSEHTEARAAALCLLIQAEASLSPNTTSPSEHPTQQRESGSYEYEYKRD